MEAAEKAGYHDKASYDKFLEAQKAAADAAQKRKEESQRQTEQAVNNEAEIENPKDKALNEAFGFLGPNKLEKATFIFGASKKDWQDFTDGGGLNNENVWQGLLIENVELRFDRTNMVKEVSFVTPTSLTSPKGIRSKIDVICGFSEAEWNKTNGNYLSGSAKNGKCSAIYLPQNDELTNFEITRLH